MTFGDESTVFNGFDTEDKEDKEFLDSNDGKVNLTEMGFAEEWVDSIDFSRSYAFIEDGKLNVVVYGLPSSINKKSVEEYYSRNLNHYIDAEYGEFFETEPGCPICMLVIKNGETKIV
jgi:hypothetical protein